LIKYLGSKRLLMPHITDIVSKVVPQRGAVTDLFSGTSRVGHALKRAGYCVTSNDHNAYAATLARCYVEADAQDHAVSAQKLVAELNRLPGKPGYFTETFCERSRFFHPKNGARVDQIRDRIAALGLEPELEAVMLTALVEAADRVDSTVGLQMAYLKQWAARAHSDLELRVPELLPRAAGGKGRALHADALEAAQAVSGDLCYLDPPYNQHKYLGNYHIWETLTLWDKPEVYGVACKRVDCQTRSSPFNSKPRAVAALGAALAAAAAGHRHLLVSFNNEGFVSAQEIETMLQGLRKHTRSISVDFKRHVGAQIGVYSPSGEKVGEAGPRKNVEHLFFATDDDQAASRL
jgi:adenine-specific DNA-methyltransferase